MIFQFFLRNLFLVVGQEQIINWLGQQQKSPSSTLFIPWRQQEQRIIGSAFVLWLRVVAFIKLRRLSIRLLTYRRRRLGCICRVVWGSRMGANVMEKDMTGATSETHQWICEQQLGRRHKFSTICTQHSLADHPYNNSIGSGHKVHHAELNTLNF